MIVEWKCRDRKCWWTVVPDPMHTAEDTDVSPLMQRALQLLTQLLRIQSNLAWKVIQLACVTLWNTTSRSRKAERFLLESGIGTSLLSIARWSDLTSNAFNHGCLLFSEAWPVSVRNCATGLLQSFFECCAHSAFVGFGDIVETLVGAIRTEAPLLELNGAVGLARFSFLIPFDCLHAKHYAFQCKSMVAELGGTEVLCSLLRRLNRRHE